MNPLSLFDLWRCKGTTGGLLDPEPICKPVQPRCSSSSSSSSHLLLQLLSSPRQLLVQVLQLLLQQDHLPPAGVVCCVGGALRDEDTVTLRLTLVVRTSTANICITAVPT